MPELGPSGSVRGAVSNHRPYRDPEHLQQRAWTEGETTMATVKIGGRTTGIPSVDEPDDRHLL